MDVFSGLQQIGILAGLLEKLLNLFKKTIDLFKPIFSPIIKLFFTKTVNITSGDEQHLAAWWHIGYQENKPVMHIHGEFSVKNLTDRNIRLVKVNLSKCKSNKIITKHTLVKHPEKNIYSPEYPILPHDVSKMTFDIIYQDVLQVKGETFKTKIFIIDEFGNKHKLKMMFRST